MSYVCPCRVIDLRSINNMISYHIADSHGLWKIHSLTKRIYILISYFKIYVNQRSKMLTNQLSIHNFQIVFLKQCETHNRQDKFLCCLCCKSGPITGMIQLDRCGYVPGEAIQFNAEIQNMTSRVCGIHVKLTMVHNFFFINIFF